MEQLLNTCYETTNAVRSLALYSHLLPITVTLILSFFVLIYSPKSIKKTVFFLFCILLSLWLLGDLVTWHSNNYYLVAGFWSILDFINITFYLTLLGFFILYVHDRESLPVWFLIGSVLALIIPFLFTITGLVVGDFDQPNCEMLGNDFIRVYKLYFEVLVASLIFFIGTYKVTKNWEDSKRRAQIMTLTLSSTAFLFIFSGSEYLATSTAIYEITLYALFSLPIFVLILTYNIIEQGTFKFKRDSFSLARLLFSIFIIVAAFNLTLADDFLETMTTGASVVVTTGFGLLLLRSARREMLQREEIEKLAKGLEKANNRLRELDKQKSEFVSIASHQLRSPLTAMRGYASMLIEGSFGELNEKQKEVLTHIQGSGKLMASSIEDYLSISRIESGNMKYEYNDFNLKELAEQLVDELRNDATAKGLLLLYKSDINGQGIVHADKGKVYQILHNLINNSIKYTPKGTITVFVTDDIKTKMISVQITDTGIGMNQATLAKLFEKFSRAENANEVNIKGTGLGLYVARALARAMNGEVSAASEGDGKGSTFTFTIPYVL
jgi:signal transduction histidine kinase